MTVEKAPDRARREHGAVPCLQKLDQLDQRDVILTLDRSQDHLPIGFDPLRPLVATLGLGPRRAALSPCLQSDQILL